MEIGLKERLIGAVVLVVLAAIIIPWVLKGGSAPNTTVTQPLALPAATTAVPTATYHMALDATAAGTRSAAAPAASQAPSSMSGSTPNNPATPLQTVKPSALPAAAPAQAPRAVISGKWVVQAGSYRSERNALAVEHKLAKRGYRAFISRYHTGGRTYFRVRVGPYADRASAERVVAEISRAYGGRAQVVPNS